MTDYLELRPTKRLAVAMAETATVVPLVAEGLVSSAVNCVTGLEV